LSPIDPKAREPNNLSNKGRDQRTPKASSNKGSNPGGGDVWEPNRKIPHGRLRYQQRLHVNKVTHEKEQEIWWEKKKEGPHGRGLMWMRGPERQGEKGLREGEAVPNLG